MGSKSAWDVGPRFGRVAVRVVQGPRTVTGHHLGRV